MSPEGKRESGRRILACYTVLIALVLIVYAQCGGFELVSYDDASYITRNPKVMQGLSSENMSWAFSSFDQSNYHPLTMISHMADTSFFGDNPGARHLVNVFLHMLNVLLLFVFMLRAVQVGDREGDNLYPAFFVAALFAVHPMHAESVAWVSERKDVLCAFFWLLAMISWISFARTGKIASYAVTFFLTGLAILAKPMAVTLPAALVLIDIWPLRRIETAHSNGIQIARDAGRLILEKFPLFLLSILSATLTFMAQKGGGAVQSLESFPFSLRFSNALTSWLAYVGKLVLPLDLAPFYPYPAEIPLWESTAAAIVIIGLTVLALRLIGKAPYVTTGWLWFMGTLVPVVGLVQVGDQAMADRYAYIPYMGLYAALSFGVADLVRRGKVPAKAAFGVGCFIIGALTFSAHVQASFWKDSETLYKRALAVTEDNHHMHYNYGNLLERKGELAAASEQFRSAVKADPSHYKAMTNLGNILNRKDRVDEALVLYDRALTVNESYAPAYANRGIAFHKLGRYARAMEDYRRALELNPDLADAMVNMGILEYSRGNNSRARELFRRALEVDPQHKTARKNLNMLSK